MKKPILFFLLLLSLFCNSTTAQNTTCNAAFGAIYQNGNTIKFNPVIVGDSISSQHYWNFGDGSTSFTVSPVHVYQNSGSFVVTHVYSSFGNGTANCVDSFSLVVQVQGACNLVAGFTSASLGQQTFQFQNTSSPANGIDSIRWTFGDGSISYDANPVHTYQQTGLYLVCIRVQKNPTAVSTTPCVREYCDSVYVQNIDSCILTANFYSFPDSSNNNAYTYQFVNTSAPLNANDSIRWTFGDGTTSNQINPNHTYAQPGTYNVCLVIQKRNNNGALTSCIREICHTITIAPNPPPCNLVASFYSFADTTSNNNFTFQFINTSVGSGNTDSIRWTFGDGSSSSQFNPSHTYNQPGTYQVCLRIQKRNSNGALTGCISEICHIITINPIPVPCNLVANFYSYTDTTATGNNNIHFENTSTGLNSADSIRWTFGDGSSSNQYNPNHTYAQPGTYTVCLRISKRPVPGTTVTCVSEICHQVTILPLPPVCTLVAGFYAVHDSLSTTPLPYIYHFINTSNPLANTDSVRWTFGDGTASNELNPTHSYTQPGTYTVCLRVQKRNPNGTLTNCIREICHVITITPTCNVQAHFTWTSDSSNNRRIYFNNQSVSSTATATATWSFGDGTSSVAWNPTHEYAQPGMYYVCLTVQSGPNCVSTDCDTVIIQAPAVNCIEQSRFNFTRSSTNNRLLHFVPAHVNSSWQYTWTFGDGTGSHEISPNHLYTQPGNYTACLTVYRNANCASTTCQNVTITNAIPCNNVQLSFTYRADSLMPNKVYFHAVSNAALFGQVWSFTKLPANSGTAPITIFQPNPTRIFQDSGYYRVCVRAFTSGGCLKEFCQVIRVAPPVNSNVCSLQPFPNPAGNSVQVNITLSQPQMIHAYIYNSMNVLVKDKHQMGFPGNNLVSINTSNLVAGTYTIKVVRGNQVCYAQFIKL